MAYTLRYDERADEDLKAYDPHIAIKLYRHIEEKLSREPLKFGAYLSGKLHPFRKLRIGEYRVVYRVYEKQVVVFVIAIGNRRDEEVYQKALKRILSRG